MIRPSGATLSIIAPDIVQRSFAKMDFHSKLVDAKFQLGVHFNLRDTHTNRETKVSVSRTRLYRQIRCVGSLTGVHSADLGTRSCAISVCNQEYFTDIPNTRSCVISVCDQEYFTDIPNTQSCVISVCNQEYFTDIPNTRSCVISVLKRPF